MRELLRTYYRLTKPGIVYGNALATIGGFLLASRGNVDLGLFAAALGGISLVIASACVCNNVLDRRIDKVMARTKKRALVTGRVSINVALVYAAVLGLAGFALLAAYTTALAVATAFVGFFFYVVVYGYAKRKTVHGTLIGSISGAMPPVVGYLAVTNQVDLGAWLLFFILVTWQMPHFYAIALYRMKDYKAAKLPVLPLVYGERATVMQIVAYMILFLVAVLQLAATGYAGRIYLVAMAFGALWWLKLGLQGFITDDRPYWAKQVFGRSLHILLLFCVLISLDAFLP